MYQINMLGIMVVCVIFFEGNGDHRDLTVLTHACPTQRSSGLLLGSVHLLPESVQPLPAALDKAYGSADTLVFESDLGALDAPAMQRDVLAAARGKKDRQSVV